MRSGRWVTGCAHVGQLYLLRGRRKCRRAVAKRLQAEGVIIRPVGSMGRPTAIRITIGTPEQNAIFLQAFRKVMEKAAVR